MRVATEPGSGAYWLLLAFDTQSHQSLPDHRAERLAELRGPLVGLLVGQTHNLVSVIEVTPGSGVRLVDRYALDRTGKGRWNRTG